jgi:hypothetical protein
MQTDHPSTAWRKLPGHFARAVGRQVVPCLLAVTALATSAYAGGMRLRYDDCLVDKTGLQLPDGVYHVIFRIYSDPSRLGPLWETDGPVTIQLTSGCFSYLLGESKPLPKPLREYARVWVGMSVESGREMSPRTALDVQEATESAMASDDHHPDPSDAHSRKPSAPRVFPDLYFHAGISVGLGSTSPGPDYEAYITPWQTGTGAGYQLTLAAGFRNLIQVQYRPRMVTSSDLNQFQVDSVVPLDYHVDDEFVGKVNVLGFRKPTTGKVPVIFLTYGVASTGSVRQVDKVGTGFVQGSSTMIGLEVGLLTKVTGVGLHIERRATTFRSFYWEPVGTVEDEVDASFWTIGINVAVGTGLFF